MPMFEYVCEKCGNRFEKLQKSGAQEESSCPQCGCAEVKKQLSSFASAGASSPASCNSGG